MRRRRHRFVTVPSALLLFVCLFLPAVQSCGERIAPYEVGFYPPYLVGLVMLALVLVPPRARTVITFVWRVLLWILIACSGVFAMTVGVVEPLFAAIALAIAAGVTYVIGSEPAVEEMAAARVVIATALVGITYFGVWLYFESDVLYGMYVSAFACLGMFAGGIEWRREVLRDRVSVEFPAARLR